MEPERVELKININVDGVRRAKKHLGLADGDATRATIWFGDRPGRDAHALHFDLADRDVIVRLRHNHGADSDATIKYRREPPLQLSDGWSPATTTDFKVEGDWTVSAQNVAASLSSTVAGAAIDEAGFAGPPMAPGLSSDDQRRFAAALLAPSTLDVLEHFAARLGP